MALRDYRRRRDFSKTSEPEGAGVASGGRRFVVQKHAASRLHYDLRLESGGVLWSWAVPKGPSLDPTVKSLAVRTEDHPVEYADFEGVIPKGQYGAGTMMVWDAGTWAPIGDPEAGLAKGDLKFEICGRKLRGAWVLVRMRSADDPKGVNWLLIKKKDAHARSVRSGSVTRDDGLSVLTGRSMEEIASGAPARAIASEGTDALSLPGARRARMPASPRPQLATPAEAAPEGDDWLHEIKLDGYRLLACKDGDGVRLLTRNGHDWTDRFPSVAAALGALALKEAVLDGEVVVHDARGVSDFHALQRALGGRGVGACVYEVFDVLYADGVSLTRASLVERKAFLAAVLERSSGLSPRVRYCDHVRGRGGAFAREASEAGLEGVISKRASAAYASGRSSSWLKVKFTTSDSFIVCGRTAPKSSRRHFGALLLARRTSGGGLRLCGRVGSGFDDRSLAELDAALSAMEADGPVVENPPRAGTADARGVTWVSPRLVVDVEFTGWTPEGMLRHPVYRGRRDDLTPEDTPTMPSSDDEGVKATVVRLGRGPDAATVSGVPITHPDRAVYPEAGLTKLCVAEYYERVAARMGPHVFDRPLSVVRCPEGVHGQSFFQRHVGKGFPDEVEGVSAPGEDEPVMRIRDASGLAALVQMGVLEVHPWGCRVDRMDRPDRLILDLDPGPGVGWSDVIGAALVIRDQLSEIGLASFAKTSGGKGVHLVAPIDRRSTWSALKSFAKGFSERMARMAPRNFTATSAKSARRNRIYIDYLRNQSGATAVAAYSTRARVEATVSLPVRWDELEGIGSPESLTAAGVLGRVEMPVLSDDPWPGFLDVRQSLTKAMFRRLDD